MSQSSNSTVRRELHGARQVLSSPCGLAPNLKKAVPARESHWPLTSRRGCQLPVRGLWTTQIRKFDTKCLPTALLDFRLASEEMTPKRRRIPWTLEDIGLGY